MYVCMYVSSCVGCYSLFLLSLSSAPPTVTGCRGGCTCQCNEAAVLGAQIKWTLCITTRSMKLLGYVVVTISMSGQRN